MQQNKVGEQRWFSLFGHFNLLIILLSTSLCAQSFQDFKKLPTKTLTQTKDVKDLDYTSYLKEQWEEYTSLDALKLYEKSKPSTIFSVKEKKIISVGPKIHLKLPKLQKSISPIVSEEKIEPKEGISFDFYGAKVSFTQLQSIKDARYFPHNQEGVIKFFKEMLESDYILNLKELESVKRELKLNDWGLKLLVEELASKLGGGLFSTTGANTRMTNYGNTLNGYSNIGFNSDSTSNFKGSATATKDASFTTTVSARIVKVMQNGNYFISGKREILIDDQKQVIQISGVIRPYDIDQFNRIDSASMSDAKILYKTEGDVDRATKQGWGTKMVQSIWPF